MKKYLIKHDEPFTTDKIGRIIDDYRLNVLPKLTRYWNYYNGVHDILKRQPTDTGKPNNTVIVNYPFSIVCNFGGFLTGKPVSYYNDSPSFNAVLDILKYNDYVEEDSALMTSALIHGYTAELNWIDEDAQQRFKILDPKEVIPVYYDDLNGDLAFCIRFWVSDILVDKTIYNIEVYDAEKVTKYESINGFSVFKPISELPHYFGQVPITIFELNNECVSVFDKIIGLVDAYEALLSDTINDYDSFCDAYLTITGAMADEKELEEMKKHRVLMLPEGCSAQYLIKNVSDTQVQNLLTTINDQIYKIANSPDFTDEKFMAQSGVAVRFKLIGFENAAGQIANRFRKALQRRIELISGVLGLTDEVITWRDIDITISRNLPTDMNELVNTVNALRGLVSSRTLLQQIDWVTDVDEELKAVEEEKLANMELYQFPTNDIEDLDEDEE